MASKIQVALGVQGASEFRRAMQDSNAAVKALGTELKLTTAQFGNAATSEQGLKAQNDVLERTVLTLNEKLAEQEKALARVASEFGEASTETINFQNEVNKTKLAIANANNQIESNNELLNGMGEESESAGGGISALGAAIAGGLTGAAVIGGIKAAASAIKELTVNSIQAADELLTLSSVSGISAQKLQEFEYMSNLVDVSTETMVSSQTKLIKTMSSAADGGKAASEAFQMLGINIFDSTGHLRDADDVFWMAIERLATISNETERDALSMQLFGKSARELNPLIENLDKVAQYKKEAYESGYVQSDEELKALGELNDAYENIGKEVKIFGNEIALAFGPEIKAGIEAVTAVIKVLMTILAGLVGLIGEVVLGFQKLFGGGKDVPAVSSSAASTPAAIAGNNGSRAPSIQPINMNVTTQLDGTTLARSLYSYNASEQQRHGANFVAGRSFG